MSVFEDREKAFESKFAYDQEMRFKLLARRNRLLGIWAAGVMGFDGEEANAYALELVAADLEHAGEDDVLDKVMNDFKGAGIAVSSGEVRARMSEFLSVVASQAADVIERVA